MPGTFSGINRLRVGLDAVSDELASLAAAVPDGDGGDAELRRRIDAVRWSIDEYAIPRLGDLDGPVVAVLIGSTGAGKSTIINSLAQARISEPGAVRPTTRNPTIWCHPRHADRFGDDFLTGYSTDPDADRAIDLAVADLPMLEDLAVIDAPDFDSVVEIHREIADELLAVADVAIFVTSAQRYADAVPWEFLAKAKARGVPIRYVVNRLPRPSGGGDPADEIVADFRRRLEAEGLPVDEIVRIREQSIDEHIGGLVAEAVEPIRAYLARLTDPEYRRAVVEQAASGAVADVAAAAREVAELIDDRAEALQRLRVVVDRAYAEQRREIAESLDRGTLIKQEVVKRWQEFVGTGELLKLLAEGAGRLRSWSRRVLGGRTYAEAVVESEARSELATVLTRRADLAAAAVAAAWDASDEGRRLVTPEIRSADPQTGHMAQQAVVDWLATLTSLIHEQGEGRHRLARVASFGVNAVALSLLVTVFVHTGGLTGAEVGITAGAAAAQQTLLEHLFGSAAAANLAAKARTELDDAIDEVLAFDASRFHELLAVAMPPDSEPLRRAVAQLQLAAKAWHAG